MTDAATTHTSATHAPGRSRRTHLPAIGSIEAYATHLYRIPMLSAEEVAAVAAGAGARAEADRERLVLSHLRLVASVARGFAGYGLPQGDLIQEGTIGLIKAVERFEPAPGVLLASYALPWIRSGILEYVLQNSRMVKMASTKAQRKLFFNLRKYKGDARMLREQQIVQMCAELGVAREDVLEMETRMGGADVPIEAPLGEEGEDAFAPIDYLTAAHADPEEVLAEQQCGRLRAAGLGGALAKLDARSRRVVEARWLPGPDQRPPTLAELGIELGVSAERVRQIEASALCKIRAAMPGLH